MLLSSAFKYRHCELNLGWWQVLILMHYLQIPSKTYRCHEVLSNIMKYPSIHNIFKYLHFSSNLLQYRMPVHSFISLQIPSHTLRCFHAYKNHMKTNDLSNTTLQHKWNKPINILNSLSIPSHSLKDVRISWSTVNYHEIGFNS